MAENIGYLAQAIGALLVASSDVTAIAGSRIYCPKAPQKTDWPCVVYRDVSSVRDELLAYPGTSGLVFGRVRVFCAGKDNNYAEQKVLDRAVRTALRGYQGTVISNSQTSPVQTVEIQGIFCQTTSGVDEWDDKTGIGSIMSDYGVWYRDS